MLIGWDLNLGAMWLHEDLQRVKLIGCVYFESRISLDFYLVKGI
jgi:hypothetical protein